MSNIGKLIAAFEQCSSLDLKTVQAAEAILNTLKESGDFVASILSIFDSDQINFTIQQVAAIYFKNHIKKYYGMPEDSGGINSADCILIKKKLIPIIISNFLNRPVHQQLVTCFTLIISTDFPSEWPDLIKDLFMGYILNDSCGIGTKRSAFQLVHFTLYKYRTEFFCNEVLYDIKFYVLPAISSSLIVLLVNSSNSLISSLDKDSDQYEHTFGICLYTCQIILSILSIDLPEFIEAELPKVFEAFFKLLSYENPKLSAQDEARLESVELLKSEICQVLSLFASRYNEEFEAYVGTAVMNVLQLLGDPAKLRQSHNDALVISSINFLSATARFSWTPSPFLETPNMLQQICEYIILPNLELRETDIELVEQNPQEFIRRTLEDFEVDTRRSAANHLINALTSSFEKEISCIIPAYISRLLSTVSQTKSLAEHEQIIDAVVYLVIGLSVKTESKTFGVARVNATINLTEFLSQHLLPEISSTNESNILSRSAALKYIATFRNQLDKRMLLQLFPEIFKNLNIKNPVVHTHAAYCIQNLLTAREISEDSTTPAQYQLKFNVDELKAPLLASINPLFTLMQEDSEMGDNEYLAKCLFKILAFLNEQSYVIVLPALTKLCEIIKMKFVISANPIFNHYLWECVATCCKICAAANMHSEMEKIVLETLSTIISQADHDFIPYALQILGVLLDTTTSASPIYINLVTNILIPEQWTISTARVPGITRVLSAFFRKQNIFQVQSPNILQTVLQRVEYCLTHKKLVQVGLEFLSDILHYVSLDILRPYIQPLVTILLKKLKTNRSLKLCQQVSLNMAIIDCRSVSSVLPKTLNAIQPNLSKDFCGNIYVPSLQKTTEIYDKKLGLLALGRLITAPEMLEDIMLVRKILEAAAVLMGVTTNQEQVERTYNKLQTFHEILLDSTSLGKIEEFQGTFSALQAAKVSVAAKELEEVKPFNLLSHLKQCFNEPRVLEKISAEPIWTTKILPFLAAQQ